MKNNLMYTTLAAVLAFVGSLIYTVLFYFGILPGATLFAMSGIIVALLVLTVLTLVLLPVRINGKHGVVRVLENNGKALICAAIACLFTSALLLLVPAAVTALYIIIQFVAVFFWIFLVLTWGFLLCGAIDVSDRETCKDSLLTDSTFSDKGYNYSSKCNY